MIREDNPFRSEISVIKHPTPTLKMSTGAKNGREHSHFEERERSKLYRRARPGHSTEIVNKIVGVVKEHNLPCNTAVDVGCGSGQLTFMLANHFQKVIGTDISENMINEAREEARSQNVTNITFEVCPAEQLPLPDSSVDLLTVFNALHWLDLKPFYKEVNRVLVPGGVAAFCGFMWPESNAAEFPLFKQIRKEEFWDVIKDHADERVLLGFNGCQTIEPPFKNHFRLPKGEFTVTSSYDLARYGDLLRTLSTFKLFEESEGSDRGNKVIDAFLESAAEYMDPEKNSLEDIKFPLVNYYYGIVSVKPK